MKPKRPFYFVLLFLLMEAYPALPQEIFFNKILPPEGKTFVHTSLAEAGWELEDIDYFFTHQVSLVFFFFVRRILSERKPVI